MQDLNLTESWKYFAELSVDLTERLRPMRKVPNESLNPTWHNNVEKQLRQSIENGKIQIL